MSDFDTKSDDDGDYRDDIFLTSINKPIGNLVYVKDENGNIVEYEKTECGWVSA